MNAKNAKGEITLDIATLANISVLLKIGFFTEFFSPILSGVVTSNRTLAHWLEKSKVRVVQFAPKVVRYEDCTPEFPVVRTPSIRIGPFGLPLHPWLLFFHKKHLLKMVRAMELRLIHLQAAYLIGYLGIWLAKKLELPIVVTFHTNICLQWPHSLGKMRWLLQWPVMGIAWLIIQPLLRNTDEIIAPSEFVRKSLIALGVPPEKITVIPTAVEAPANLPSRKAARQRLGYHDKDEVVLYLGRVSSDKNLTMLLRAFLIVLKKRRRAKLLIVGGGFFQIVLKRLAKTLGILDCIQFIDAVPYEEIYWYYMAADCFALPSMDETQGLTIVEAGSAGIPAVAVRSGGVPEYVRDSLDGFLTRNDPKEFARAIIRILADPNLTKRLGRQFKANLKKTLSPDIVYPPLLAIYERLTGVKLTATTA